MCATNTLNKTPFVAAFNAKAMPYAEVARTFVPPVGKFDELAGHWNAVLVGPRGSGKTTLLKMLSIEGLSAWQGPTAIAYRDSINYSGIYVPSDIAWSEMVNALGEGKIEIRWFEKMAEAAFVTNVLLATATGMMSRTSSAYGAEVPPMHKHSVLEAAAEVDLVRVLCGLWKLTLESMSIRAVVDTLGLRLINIKSNADLLADEAGITLDRLQARMPYLGLPLIESVIQAVAAYDRVTGEPDGLWVLLLDEFEVAPAYLQRLVLASLRATGQQKLLIKVALAPCGPHTLINLQNDSPPSQNNDFRQVELWYPDKGQADEFCTQVFASRAPHLPWLVGKTALDVFGASAYSVVDNTNEAANDTNAYGRGSGWEEAFTRLAAKDVIFGEFLERRNIDPKKLDPSASDVNGSTIRKIAPVVAFRNAYLGNVPGKKRGRKPFLAAYNGWAAISAMSEGNPRWLIGMLIGILNNVSERQSLPVPVAVQQNQVMAVAYSFAETLRTVATNQLRDMKPSTPVFEALERIGNYFHDRLVVDSFVEDPPMSFTVDMDIDEGLENCLRLALNHGAIVCYERADRIGGYGSLQGKRFRLSHLLAPVFKLPVRKSKQIQLSAIIAKPLEEAKPVVKILKQDAATILNSTNQQFQTGFDF
jgi:hypothetical protein